ncbi:hypothetical protein BD560DRAFT_486332 [Blakeslea trispora]|nr:hypothetical protein BD560DRAFT_486332 [Blakeslea trispora]
MLSMPHILTANYLPSSLSKNKSLSQNPTLQQHSLLSRLTIALGDTLICPKLTRQEVLDAIGYLLLEYDESIHKQLFKCLIDHKLLKQVDDSFCFSMNSKAHTTDLSGVFLPLTNCYSPSCKPYQTTTCYSSLCPNRHKSSRLSITNCLDNQNPYVQQGQENHSINPLQTRQKNTRDWIESIPQHLKENTNREELKRQAAIAELLLTEQNYTNDLVVLHQIYAVPLLQSVDTITNPSRRKRFHKNVFGNYLDITRLHHSFHDKIASSQQSGFFVGRIGMLVMEQITDLIEPYIQYASNHIKAIHCITIEQRHNPSFHRFLEQQNAHKRTRRLGLQHYLTSPTLWIGKFKLMIEAILRHTADDADRLALQASLTALHDMLCQMNHSASKISLFDLRLEELMISIYVPSSQNSNEQQQQQQMELLSIPPQAQLLGEQTLWLARSTHPLMPSLCHVFLFSHALVLTHPRVLPNRTEYMVVPGSPIPLSFLTLDSNPTSLMRRLSFASTSMVSTPLHLIKSLKRQKSAYNETVRKPAQHKFVNRRSHSCHYHPKHGKVWDAPQSGQQEQNQTVKKKRLFCIKTKFLYFKSRWNSDSLSAPVSPVSRVDTNHSQDTPWACRRESAPAIPCSSEACQSPQTEPWVGHVTPQQQQQRKTLKVSHLACPYNTFRLEFVTRHDRLFWENLLSSTIERQSQEGILFKKKLIYKSLMLSSQPPSLSSVLSDNLDVLDHAQNMIEKITCTFVYKTIDGQEDILLIGTHQGIWLGCDGKMESLQCILSGRHIHQMAVMKDKLIVSIQTNKGTTLISYHLEYLLNSSKEGEKHNTHKELSEQAVIDSFHVLCFSVGTIKNKPMIVYLVRQGPAIWLTMCTLNDLNHPMGNRMQAQYKIPIKDPTELQIINDSIFIRSEKYGIARLEVSLVPTQPQITWIFVGTNSALIVHPMQYAIVCDDQVVYTVPLFDQKLTVKDCIPKIKFESQANQIVQIHHYLVAFSPTIIEIRDIKTGELLQVIKGTHIKLISTLNHHTQPLLFTMKSSKHPNLISMYQLTL